MHSEAKDGAHVHTRSVVRKRNKTHRRRREGEGVGTSRHLDALELLREGELGAGEVGEVDGHEEVLQ